MIFRAEGAFRAGSRLDVSGVKANVQRFREEYHTVRRNLTERSLIREGLRIRTAGGDSVTNLKEPIEAIQYL